MKQVCYKWLITISLPLFSVFFLTLKAQVSLKGRVTDSTGTALSFVTLVVTGTSLYTTSDSQGIFILSLPNKNPIRLKVSLVGYQTLTTDVNAFEQELRLVLKEDDVLEELVVTSRRRKEIAQNIPIPITVVSGALAADAGAFNVNRVKEFLPSVQLYSSNPRNTTLNIRGLGSTFGLTNDGIDPGVGFYVDGIYYARPAATTLDFVDIERIEVLRGPQGTLFGKNTTAGAFNISTHAPSFKKGVNFEVSYGNYGYIQAKTALTGAFSKHWAGRLSFSGTQRNGLLYNVKTQKYVNTLNNLGVRGQLLYRPNDNFKIRLIADISEQHPDGYAQVIAGIVPTKRPAYRQFRQIIADLNYSLPTENPFDRVIDHDAPWRSGNELGGLAANIDLELGRGTLTSTTAWRYWNWDPLNDRDFTGLPVLSKSQATSRHEQWTQEIRYVGDIFKQLNGVIGAFAIYQDLKTAPFHIEEAGSAQWRFAQSSTSANWRTTGLFDGFGIKTNSKLQTLGTALFGQLDWRINKKLHLLPGIRYNYDKKNVHFDRQTYGGLQTTDPALIALKNSLYTNQKFDAQVEESNLSGQITLSYKNNNRLNVFATAATSYKPIGINLGGLPTANGEVLIQLARIKPEYVSHGEIGLKTAQIVKGLTFNLTAYITDIKDYQTQVQTAEVGVNRGYLANAERVRVRGIELDGQFKTEKWGAFYGALAYTEGVYVSFKNAPVPLEETGSANAYKDISGGRLPGISKWAGSLGSEWQYKNKFMGYEGHYFWALEASFRSNFSSSPSPSQYLNIDGYALCNARLGFRTNQGISAFLWTRNIFNQNYFEQLLPAAGNAGHYAAVLGDPRTIGITLRYVWSESNK